MMATTRSDPILAEVRAVRDAHAARFNYDVKAISEDIRAKQKALERDYVSYPPRRVMADAPNGE